MSLGKLRGDSLRHVRAPNRTLPRGRRAAGAHLSGRVEPSSERGRTERSEGACPARHAETTKSPRTAARALRWSDTFLRGPYRIVRSTLPFWYSVTRSARPSLLPSTQRCTRRPAVSVHVTASGRPSPLLSVTLTSRGSVPTH